MELFTRFSEGGGGRRGDSRRQQTMKAVGGGGSLTGRSTTKILKPPFPPPPPPTPATWEINNDRPLGVNKTRWGRRGDLKESAYCNFRSLL